MKKNALSHWAVARDNPRTEPWGMAHPRVTLADIFGPPHSRARMGATDFDDDDHTTLCVSLITSHGRAAPLVWRTVKKSKLKNRRTGYELEMVERVLDRINSARCDRLSLRSARRSACEIVDWATPSS
jgi:hypothetical protein